MQRRALLCGYYGMGNGGDEALLATLLHMLPPDVGAIVLSKVPAETQQRYGVEAVDRWNWQAVWRALRRADVFIWGGGSLIQDVSSRVSPLYYLGLMKLAQILGLQTIAWAQGIGPLQGRFHRWLTRHILARCDRVSVRDRASAELLQHWGIPHTLAPDPVWAMELPQARPQNQQVPPLVAVNLRQHRSLTPERLACLSTALMQFQQQTQAQIWLVPFQASLDLDLAEYLQQQLLPGTSQVIQRTTPEDLRHLFNQVDLAIVMRLHALIMAAAAGCRCLALSYDPKVTQVATSLALPAWDMATLSDDVNYLTQSWCQILTTGYCLNLDKRREIAQSAQTHQQLLEHL